MITDCPFTLSTSAQIGYTDVNKMTICIQMHRAMLILQIAAKTSYNMANIPRKKTNS